uniref:PPUP7066 n=1 Tax=Poeciliopsis prolifica TaxID=188132 RepID=A0A0S7ETY8_9TELE
MKTGSIAQKKEASVCQSTPLAIAIVKSTILAVMMMARNFLPLQMTTVDAKRPNQFHPAFKSSNSTTSSRSETDLSPLSNKIFSFHEEYFFLSQSYFGREFIRL